MKVLIATGPPPLGWTKFHRDAFCSGLRNGEVTHGAEYLERDLEELPETVKPCQFECCFPGYASAADLKSRVHDPSASKPARGIKVGQLVEFRLVGQTEVTTVRLVEGPANRADRELSKSTPYAKALLGHESGDVVDVVLQQRVVHVEILTVT